MEIINLNLIPTGTRPVVHASQYDNGRQFRANLFEGASVYTLTGAETLTFSVRKPDGHIVTEGVTNTSDNYVVIETTTQMCAWAGDSFAELKIENGDDLIGTLNLILAVEQSPEEGGDPSESFIHNLEEQIAEAVADQYDADSVVFDNTPTQGHGIGFAVTSEGVANAVQDAKDYTDTEIGGLSIPENITDLADVNITTPTNGEIMVYNNGVWENQANPSSTQNFAPDYDDTATYNTNDKVIYQGLLYVCLEDSITGAWDSTKWQQISVADFTADLLPIESGSATNTKDYIDSKVGVVIKTSDIVRNTTYISSTDFLVECYVINKLCILSITNIKTSANMSGENEMLSGLPLPITASSMPLSIFNGSGDNTIRVRVTTDGKLKDWYTTIPSGTSLFGVLVYPIA